MDTITPIEAKEFALKHNNQIVALLPTYGVSDGDSSKRAIRVVGFGEIVNSEGLVLFSGHKMNCLYSPDQFRSSGWTIVFVAQHFEGNGLIGISRRSHLEEMFGTVVNAPDLTRYPHRCSLCSSQAYVALFGGRTDCSSASCSNFGAKA